MMQTAHNPSMPAPVFFGNFRLIIYIIVFAFSATVLGLSAHLASLFLPNIHHDFSIFSLIIPSLTIFTFLLLIQWSQPRIEVPVLFVLASLWIAMGSWSADIIGPIECFPLAGQQTPTKNGQVSSREYCYEMKVIEAFSWANFIVLAGFFVIVIALASRAKSLGRRYCWMEDIRYLPWFGEFPGYQQYPMGQQGYYYPGQQYPGGGYVVQQNAGHSLVIQPGANGGPPAVTQIPGSVTTA